MNKIFYLWNTLDREMKDYIIGKIASAVDSKSRSVIIQNKANDVEGAKWSTKKLGGYRILLDILEQLDLENENV